MVKDILEQTLAVRKKLQSAGIESAGFEARQLVKEFYDGTDSGRERLNDAVERRMSHEPLQYIIGEWEFYGLPFFVGSGVLIPRADTELLVDLALEYLDTLEGANVADLCSGSGCIAVSVAYNSPKSRVTAVELSGEAYRFLERNIKRNGVKVTAIKGNALTHCGEYDLVVSNPPYIKTADITTLEKELSFEPEMALDGGADGVGFYRDIAANAQNLLKPGGKLMVEIGFDEGKAVQEIFLQSGFADVCCKKDFSGNDRVVIGTWAPPM